VSSGAVPASAVSTGTVPVSLVRGPGSYSVPVRASTDVDNSVGVTTAGSAAFLSTCTARATSCAAVDCQRLPGPGMHARFTVWTTETAGPETAGIGVTSGKHRSGM